MAIITEPMALDKSFNTTETTPRSQADVLAGIEQAILQGMGRQANEVAYDNTTSGLSANDVQEAIDELADEKVDKVTGKGLSTNDYTNDEKTKLEGIEQGAEVNVQADWAQTDSSADDFIKNKQLVTEPIEELQNDVQSTQTATGNPLTLTDCAPINAESLVVELEPKQDLHGYDYPWVGGAGKNKLPLDLATMKSLNSGGTWSGNVYTHNNGVTFTVLTDSDGNVTGIKANGTASVTLSFVICNVTYSSGSFYLTGLTDYGNGSTRFNLRLTSGGTTISDYFSASGTEFSVTESTTFLCAINIYGGYTCSDLMFYPMVRLSSIQDTTFGKWSNICPITGYTECEVDDVGFNLISEIIDNKYINHANGQAATAEGFYCTDFIKLDANTVYYFKDSSDNNQWGAIYDLNKTFISAFDVVGNTEFTSPNYDCYFRITVHADKKSSVNISKTTGTPKNGDYVPYQSSNASIQFGQTVYGGRSNFTDGGTDENKIKVKVSDLTPYGHYNGTNATCSSFSLSDNANSVQYNQTHGAIADRMTEAAAYYGWHHENEEMPAMLFFSISTDGTLLSLYDEDTTLSQSDFLAKYGDTEICYPKATPTTISTPPTELKLLQDTNTLTTNGTTINLGYQPDNVIGEVKGEIEQHLEMPYLRILDNDVDTEIKNYQLYYRMIASAYTLVNLAEMLQHRFLFVEVIQNPSGTANDKLLHSALIDPRTIDGFEYQMKAGTGDTVCIKTNITENKLDLYVQSTGTHTSGDPTDYYVTIRMVD